MLDVCEFIFPIEQTHNKRKQHGQRIGAKLPDSPSNCALSMCTLTPFALFALLPAANWSHIAKTLQLKAASGSNSSLLFSLTVRGERWSALLAARSLDRPVFVSRLQSHPFNAAAFLHVQHIRERGEVRQFARSICRRPGRAERHFG